MNSSKIVPVIIARVGIAYDETTVKAIAITNLAYVFLEECL